MPSFNQNIFCEVKMKIIAPALVLSLLLAAAPLEAKVKSIIDWDGGSNPYKPDGKSIVGADGRLDTTCGNACPPPFSITTTNCAPEQILVHCKAEGCGYYNYCRNKTDKNEAVAQNDEIGQNYNDLELNELLKEIEAFDQPEQQ